MQRNSLSSLGETEMEVLNHVWELGSATVAQVRERILATRDVAYTTIMTVMKNLSDKGYLEFSQKGAAYEYRPARTATEVRSGIAQSLVDKVFEGSTLQLVETLVRNEDLSESDLTEIRKLIDSLEEKDGNRD
ncbi:MAG: BlaI/MecI/CopY family transcriptional regulator [Rhodothermia bacterium]|nr:BlaI/MecI/CopY family transcriptional regulator [Rhodothermia bacterium]